MLSSMYPSGQTVATNLIGTTLSTGEKSVRLVKVTLQNPAQCKLFLRGPLTHQLRPAAAVQSFVHGQILFFAAGKNSAKEVVRVDSIWDGDTDVCGCSNVARFLGLSPNTAYDAEYREGEIILFPSLLQSS